MLSIDVFISGVAKSEVVAQGISQFAELLLEVRAFAIEEAEDDHFIFGHVLFHISCCLQVLGGRSSLRPHVLHNAICSGGNKRVSGMGRDEDKDSRSIRLNVINCKSGLRPIQCHHLLRTLTEGMHSYYHYLI